MMRETGCDGVVVGRGCLGRPWLFADLVARMCDGRRRAASGPALRRGRGDHGAARRRCWASGFDERGHAVSDFRKHVGLVSQGLLGRLRAAPAAGHRRDPGGLREGLAELDLDQPWPAGADGPRGTHQSARPGCTCPTGWLNDPYDSPALGADAELGHLGRLIASTGRPGRALQPVEPADR